MTASTSPDTDLLNIPRALVVYASTHGHTAKIAARIAQAMVGEHVAVDLRDVADAADADPGDYDVVVVGASLHKEHHQRAIVDWVTARSAALEQRPSVFFSVSLSAADDSDKSRAATQHCIDEFCAQTAGRPDRPRPSPAACSTASTTSSPASSCACSCAGWDHPTNAAQDYDYTDWDAVDRLGRQIGALAGPAVPA